MRASQCFRSIAISAAVFFALLAASQGRAQDQSSSCGSGSPYSPARAIVIAGIDNCDEVVREIERATDRFFNGECALLEARKRALDPRSYATANQLVQLARSEFAAASDALFEVAAQIDGDLELVDSEQSGAANDILKIYGYSAPKTYSEAFKILADAINQAAGELGDVRFGQDGNESFVLDSMYGLYGAMVRPGGVFRAIAILLRQAVA